MKKLLICTFAVAALSSCAWFSEKDGKKPDGATAAKKEFRLPTPPAMTVSDDNYASFYAEHFWDNLDFADTTQTATIDANFMNYVYVLASVPHEMAQRSVAQTLEKAEADTVIYLHFTDIFGEMLYDPNSPVRNEELYITVLEDLLGSGFVSDIEKERYKKRLAMALRNRVDDRATDFTYNLANGATGRLYSIRAEYTLLFFSNPGCPACREITEALKSSDMVSSMIKGGRMKVLVVYPDEDVAGWRAHKDDFPAAWINAYDKSLTLRGKGLYDLKAIPTLYLLDEGKKVLIKDFFSVNVLESYMGWQESVR